MEENENRINDLIVSFLLNELNEKEFLEFEEQLKSKQINASFLEEFIDNWLKLKVSNDTSYKYDSNKGFQKFKDQIMNK